MDAKSRQRIREMPHPRLISNHEQPHNTINRLTSTTGEGMFAPYSESCSLYLPDMKLVIFALLDSDATDVNRVVTAFERIGRWGYGKDASTGHGRFLVDAYKELTIPLADSPNACYTLGPTVPEKGTYSSCFFAPFVRFGKHGDVLVRSGNPFKNPVIMADEGAIFMTENEEVFRKPFIGRAVRDVSKANPKSVCQGYSIYLPFRMEM
jgi:CRISPR-associated protein Csm4